jgi:hypothetical protein
MYLQAAIDARMFHERNITDKTLYKRLVRVGTHSPKAGTTQKELTPTPSVYATWESTIQRIHRI